MGAFHSYSDFHLVQQDKHRWFLLRIHGNAYIARPHATYFEQLPEFQVAADRLSCAGYVCTGNRCFVCDLAIHTTSAAVIWSCRTDLDRHWSKFARWSGVSLMVSKGISRSVSPVSQDRMSRDINKGATMYLAQQGRSRFLDTGFPALGRGGITGTGEISVLHMRRLPELHRTGPLHAPLLVVCCAWRGRRDWRAA